MSVPVVFIGSSMRGYPIAEDIAKALASVVHVRLWKEVFGATGGTFADLLKLAPAIDAAIMVFTPDDQLSTQRQEQWSDPQPAPRDNVVFELGLWIGALSRERVVFVEPSEPRLKLPTDLEGINAVRIPTSDRSSPMYEEGLQNAVSRLIKWLQSDETRSHTQAIVQWPTPAVESRRLLNSPRGDANHSVIMMGNTMFQTQSVYHGDMVRWLSANPTRRIGMMFLNPHGPHARRSGRDHLVQGQWERGLEAYKDAVEKPWHPHFVPLVYDGPYRYSLRGIDVAPHTWNRSSEMLITHSTHDRGIAGGFSHSLPLMRGMQAFESFSDDVLNLWKSAYANPPGHGITIAVCRPEVEDASLTQTRMALEEASQKLAQMVKERHGYQRPVEFMHPNPSQWHFTLCSMRRTGSRWGAPLTLSQLPTGFVDYATASCNQLQRGLQSAGIEQIVPRLTHLKLFRTGHLIAFNPSPSGPMADVMRDFLASRRDEVKRFGLDATTGGPFIPKHLDFWPHVSVGMLFHNEAALPEPVTFEGDELFVELPRPVTWRSDEVRVIHYAYRSFRRLVGSTSIPLKYEPVTNDSLICRLRL